MAFEDRRTSESETPAACAQVARSLRAIVDSDPVGSEVDSGSSAWNGRTRAWSVHAERHTGNRNRGTDSASVVKPMKPLIIRRNSFVILAMNEGRTVGRFLESSFAFINFALLRNSKKTSWHSRKYRAPPRYARVSFSLFDPLLEGISVSSGRENFEKLSTMIVWNFSKYVFSFNFFSFYRLTFWIQLLENLENAFDPFLLRKVLNSDKKKRLCSFIARS